jgi:TP901 family phage tail tape measure protein
MSINAGSVTIGFDLDTTSYINKVRQAAKAGGKELAEVNKIQSHQLKLMKDITSLGQQNITLSKNLTAQEKQKLTEINRQNALATQRVKLANDLLKIEQTLVGQSGKAAAKLRDELTKALKVQNELSKQRINLGFDKINADLKETNRGVLLLQTGLKGAGTAFKGLAIATGIGAAMVAVGGLLSVLAAPITATKKFLELDLILADLSAVTGSTREQMQPLTAEIERLGLVTSKTPAQIGETALALSRLGFNADETKASLEGVARGSEATGMDMASMAETIGTIVKTNSLAASESLKVADIMVTASNNSAQSADQMSEAWQKATINGSAYNQTIESQALVLGVLADAGMRGDIGGTAYENMSKALKDQTADWEALGVAIYDADGTMRQMPDILEDLRGKLAGLNDEQKALILQQLAPDQRGERGILGYLNISSERIDVLDEKLKNAGGNAMEAAEVRLDSFSGQIQLLGGTIDTFSVRAGDSFAPFGRAGVEALNDIFLGLLDNDALFEELKLKGEDFARLLDENPQIIDAITKSLDILITKGLDIAVEQADRLVEFLSDEEAVDDMLEGMAEFTETLGSAVELTGRLLDLTVSIGEALTANNFAMELGLKMRNQLAPSQHDFGAEAFTDSAKSSAVTSAAEAWVGNHFKKGVQAQCAYFVRAAFEEAGIDLGVSADRQSSGDPRAGTLGAGFASSLIGEDIGAVRRTKDPTSIPEGAIIGFTNTYGNFEDGAITHVGISTGGGQMVDRSTFDSPVRQRAITTFPTTSSGEYIYVVPKAIAAQTIPQNNTTVTENTFESSGRRTPSSASRSEFREDIGANGNLNRFLDAVAFLESGGDPTEVNESSDARGAFQFTPITRRDAAELGLANPGDTGLSYEEQRRRTGEYIRVRDPKGYAAAAAGDYDEAIKQLRNRWVSLPGGSEAHQTSDRYDQFNAMLRAPASGSSSATGGSADPGSLAYLESLNADSKEAREAERAKVEAEREAERVRREALDMAREARASAIEVRSESNKLADQERQAVIDESRRLQDNAIEAARANNPTSELVQEVAAQAEGRLSIFRNISDEIEANNRAARDLNQAIADQRSNATIEEPVNEDMIALYEKQIAQLGKSNEALRKQRDTEIELLTLKYKQLTAEEQRVKAAERAAELTELQRTNASLQLSYTEAMTEDPMEQLALQRDRAMADIASRYEDQFIAIREQLIKLTAEADSLQSMLELDPSAAIALEEVNNELAHTTALLNALGQNRTLEETLAGIDAEKYFLGQQNDFLSDLSGRNREASLYDIERNSGQYGRRSRDREIGREEINQRRNNDLNRAFELFGSGDQFQGAATQIERIANTDLSKLIEQTKTLGEEFADQLSKDIEDTVLSVLDGTKTMGEAFSDLFSNLAKQLMQLAVTEGFKAVFGGMMGGGAAGESSGIGSVIVGGLGKILGFANGGMVSAPTLAMIGEGQYNEAVVPLPDGRSIPVQLSGGGGEGMSGNVTVTVNNNGSVDVFSDSNSAAGLAATIKALTKKEIANASRSDGAIGSQFQRRSR